MLLAVQYMELIKECHIQKHNVDHPISLYAASKNLMN